ncbi:MAG: hypothetical protein OXG02_08310 [Chloroflexi bacterium]|nr:hypothetical protein [Chloroflexota bacterium]
MSRLRDHRPCAHCERELPGAEFRNAAVEYCRACERELRSIMARKYDKISQALQRAQERQRTQAGG